MAFVDTLLVEAQLFPEAGKIESKLKFAESSLRQRLIVATKLNEGEQATSTWSLAALVVEHFN